MTRAFVGVATAACVLAVSAAASPSAVSVRGIVVGKQHGVLLVASSRGLVRAVSGRASVGSRVLVRGGRVVGRAGRAHSALIRGVVVRRNGRLTFLSTARHLLVVHTSGRRLASATDTAPAPGAVVQQTVSFNDQGNLDDQGEQQLGQSSQAQIQATVAAVGTGTVTLTVNGQTLTVPLPAGLTLPSSLVGTQVTLNLSFTNGQTTASEQGDNDQQSSNNQQNSSDPQGTSEDNQQGTTNQQGGNEQSDNEVEQQNNPTTTTTTDQQTTTTDQQTTTTSSDNADSGGDSSSGGHD